MITKLTRKPDEILIQSGSRDNVGRSSIIAKASERKAILQDSPTLNCPAMEVARLDDDVKTQLRSKRQGPSVWGREDHVQDSRRTPELGVHSLACGQVW